MRKAFFSLLATLAFGSFAMANNVEVETVEVESVKMNEPLHEVEINGTCTYTITTTTYNWNTGQSSTSSTTYTVSASSLEDCQWKASMHVAALNMR